MLTKNLISGTIIVLLALISDSALNSYKCEAGTKLGSGRIILVFEKGTKLEDAKSIVSENGLEIEHFAGGKNWMLRPHMILVVPEGKEEEWISKLKAYGQVKHASQCDPFVMPSETDKDYCQWPTS
jgi:hypothetical protein